MAFSPGLFLLVVFAVLIFVSNYFSWLFLVPLEVAVRVLAVRRLQGDGVGIGFYRLGSPVRPGQFCEGGLDVLRKEFPLLVGHFDDFGGRSLGAPLSRLPETVRPGRRSVSTRQLAERPSVNQSAGFMGRFRRIDRRWSGCQPRGKS